ncbi:hypothetical protein BST81_00885 [Leptolyngbya sp. 'hensonii']|uniref:DUF4058 family protein n=1 Tax=Leptolyngbya sp. 'hensonii' TaxID=1922337 RepID=UPI00094F4F86|nr:DUF4058 family protein [Leptolyngbya sp. 'hensonii']OLP20323.1 hypothetical protein BST81_00885 [Leptolyngbya sp. 'hensonii']
MSSPFPGVDPYLESADLWPEVHHRLITAIAIDLAPQVRPKYRVAIEKRVYLSGAEDTLLVGVPDVSVSSKPGAGPSPQLEGVATVQPHPIQIRLAIPEEVREGYLEIREVVTGVVVTAIEVLSPKNKRPGEGLEAYERKRRQMLVSMTHLVEIDLLKAGRSTVEKGDSWLKDYHILVSRSDRRPIADLYAFNLSEAIPVVPVPLGPEEAEPELNLQRLMGQIYEQAGFDTAIDYGRSPVASFPQDTLDWIEGLLRQQGYR